jgi:4-amino-4-deoxy-L-arabinose transferase-like glycosyltransferase
MQGVALVHQHAVEHRRLRFDALEKRRVTVDVGRRRGIRLILLLFALLPTSVMAGTRIMAEWPYFMMSILFLLALGRLKKSRTLSAAVLCGLLLGAATLTKFVGVLLGFAILAQVIVRLRSARGERPLRSGWPECLAAAIGGGLFLLWKLRMQTHRRSQYRPYAPPHVGFPGTLHCYQCGWVRRADLNDEHQRA